MTPISRLQLALGVALCLFTVAEVNYPLLTPQSDLAIFAGLGLVLCFLRRPLHPRWADVRALRWVDRGLAVLSALCCTYLVVQSEPLFRDWWIGGTTLGHRAGQETTLDIIVGAIGLVLVLEATRRAIGLTLPLLTLAFLAYASWGASLPDWLFPHRGYDLERLVSQSFLHGQGIFGVALRVMFTYVVLFILFGVVLEVTGATGFILESTRRLFRRSPGGAAKVAVLSSGLMGSLSGSAVANTATTGTFTIPMMRGSGFPPRVAAGVEAAASSGGALVPPVMGAGAYLMLEIVEPAVTYLEIIRAALIPAMLYYLSLFLIVHFQARKLGSAGDDAEAAAPEASESSPERGGFGAEGLIFCIGFAVLIAMLVARYSAFRAVSVALAAIFVAGAFHPRTRIGPRRAVEAAGRAARDMVPLIAAAACVGVIVAVVTLTGIGSQLASTLLPLAENNLLLALAAIMVSSIILGMGLPSAVCYLLMATLIGTVLQKLGLVPLAAHLFIFYFGMMSMVTPPVALAAYTAAGIAGSNILSTSFAAFRFALVGFTLPYMFVLQPELLMLTPEGTLASWGAILPATALAILGLIPFAAGIAGYLFAPLGPALRAILLVASFLLLVPGPAWTLAGRQIAVFDLAGLVLLAVGAGLSWRERRG